MKRKTTISLLIALSLILLQIPASKGATDEWETDFVDEDLFIASYLFEGVDMIYLQGDGMRIIGYYWFEGPVMQASRYIKEAYLEVYVPSAMAPDPDAIMEIYGKPSGKGGTPSYAEDPGVVNGPYTTNFYQVNLSSFVGAGTLHNITVTRILREINQGYYFWDGHDIAFVTRAHDGHDEERSIASLESGHPAKLYIHYGQPDPGDPEYPPWLPPDGVFVEDYRNYTIWKEDTFSAALMSMYFEDQDSANDFYYGEYHELLSDPTDHIFIADNTNPIETPPRNTITRVNNTILILEDPAQVTMHFSNDNGLTWSSHNLNNQFTDLAAHSTSSGPSMWVDDNSTVHMIWGSYTTTSPAAEVGVYSNFTVLANGTIDYFDGFTEFTEYFDEPNIEVDRHGRIHICYTLSDTLYYRYRHVNGTWEPRETILNSGNSILESSLDVADHPNATRPPIVRFVYQHQWVGNEYTYQTIRSSDGTLANTALSSNNCFRANSGLWREGNKSIAVYNDNPGGASAEIEFRIYDFNTMTLGASQYVTATDQAHHWDPDIGIDETLGIAYFVWQTQYGGDLCFGRRYNLTSDSFVAAQEVLTNPLNIEWVQIIPWASAELAYTTYFIADMNGTLIDTYTTTEDNETLAIEEVEDFVDEVVYGYPDPEDPDPPGWEDSIFTANQFKLGLFLAGLIMFLGAPIYGFAERPEAATWIIILFTSLCGVALLWSLQTM